MSVVENTYRCGTLTYTRLGLINLFVWLLWGDFCYTIMATMMPTLVPLMLRSHDASNFTIGLLVGSVPAILNFIINPIVSTTSDRTRSRWGRRRPFLMFSPPFVVISLILLGWSDNIGAFFYQMAWGDEGSPATFIICLIAIFTISYQAFDLFVGAVYSYLFADVVPLQFIGRFMALFRMVGALGGMCFNLVVLPLADVHMPMIFTVIAIIYFLSFTAMCINVKEGEYPPPATVAPGILPMVKMYVRECFSIPFFFILFIGLGMNYASTVCRGIFNLLFATETLGLSLRQYGNIAVVGSIVAIVLYIPAGILVDRLHPLRVYMMGAVLVILANLFGFFFVSDFYSFFIVAVVIAIVYVFQDSSMLPICVKLYPKAKFGQFCSAAAMVKALLLVAANAGGGAFIDWLGYQYIFIWDLIFTSICLCVLIWVYRKWKTLGGDRNYTPPCVET